MGLSSRIRPGFGPQPASLGAPLACGVGMAGDNGPSVPSPLGAISLNSIAANHIIGSDPGVTISGNSMFVGLPDTSKNQNLLEIDATTGQLISTRTMFVTTSQDDHNVFDGPMLGDDASLTALACGHQDGIVINCKRSPTGSLSGFGSNSPISANGTTTYSNTYKSPDISGQEVGYDRVSQQAWDIEISANNGASWGAAVKFVDSGGDQMYIKADRVAANLLWLIAYLNPAVGTPTIRIATLNLSTLDIKSGSGTLGNLASAGTMPTNLSDWTVLYTASGTDLPSVTNVIGADKAFAMLVTRKDQQYTDAYVGRFTGADVTSPFTAAEWAFDLVDGLGFGVGATPPDAQPPYYRSGKFSLSVSPGKPGLQGHLSRQYNGISVVETVDRISGVWRPTRVYAEKALGDTDTVFRPLPLPSDKVPCAYYDGTYQGYPDWTGGVKTVCITRFATVAPVWSGASNYNVPERRNYALNVAALFNQPVAFWVSGGDDAAKFFAHGSRLYFKGQDFANPTDTNTDNVYNVQITALPVVLNAGQAISDGLATTVSFTFTVTDLTNTGASPLNKWTRDLTHTSSGWTYTGITAPSAVDGTAVDPEGGHTMYKLVRAATTGINHRGQQTITLLPNTQYEMEGIGQAGTLNFAGLSFFDGTTNFGAVFDILRGEFVAPRTESGGALDFVSIEPLPNSNWRMRIAATTGPSIGTCNCLFSAKSFGGSRFSESYASTGNIFMRDVMISATIAADFVVRTV